MPHDYWEALWPDPAAVLKLAGLERGTDAVDLCCGDGWFLGAARKRLQDAGMKNCEFREGDAYDLPRGPRTELRMTPE